MFPKNRQPALSRAIEPAQFEVQVAEPIRRIVADVREKVRREDPFEGL